MEKILPVFTLFIAVAVVIRVVAGSIDKDRIAAYMKERHWRLVKRRWDPMGPGWLGNQHQRIYEVDYRDDAGRLRRAHVQTSMFSGVYLTNDRILEDVPDARGEGPEAAALREENDRLKERIAELESGQAH